MPSKTPHASNDIHETLRKLLASDAGSVHRRISDLHLCVGQPIRYRMDAGLFVLEGYPPLTTETFNGIVQPIVPGILWKDWLAHPTMDIDLSHDSAYLGCALRINLFRDVHGPACTLRFLPDHAPTPEAIGFPSDMVWRQLTDMKQGLVIVTGITGSGKTTTLASLLQHIIDTRPVRVLTLEDPVEYRLHSTRGLVSQRELNTHISSFAQGLRSALRESPDIICVGEIRDRESAQLALNAAETGHLVFSTLHSKDARGAVQRLMGFFPVDQSREVATQISLVLDWVLAQKLVPRADGMGRILAMETLRILPSVAHHIRANRLEQLYSSIETGHRHGMKTMERSLIDLARQGLISVDDAIQHANDPSMIEGMLGR